MKLKPRNFPHPVLNPLNDDFEKKNFGGQITSQTKEYDMFVFSVEFNLDEDHLKKLIQKEKASYNVHFECTSTMQRFNFPNIHSTFSFKVPIALVNKRIDVNFFILANEDMNDYCTPSFHSDFNGLNFQIQKGDILAFGEPQTIHITKKNLTNTKSIFKISKDTTSSQFGIKTHLDDHQINVIIPEEMYKKIEKIQAFGEDCNKVLVSMFYLPALVDTLHKIQLIAKEENDLVEIENYDWYHTLQKKLKDMDRDINQLEDEEILKFAYKLLNTSKIDSLISLENILYGYEQIGEDEK
ncbi:hypothetical protein [Bacillus safensis]|uniref:hypothetical protein n=1 Tax=Bacillus safensis TaxID=561879 RepID=UPI0009BF6032|nr:hypothetical protein [Bacillus safensis]ARD57147.1 hypothetical protein BRL64_13520 [Bacillus safensis]